MTASKVMPRKVQLPSVRRREDENVTHIEGRAGGMPPPDRARIDQLADRISGRPSQSGNAGGSGAGSAQGGGDGSGLLALGIDPPSSAEPARIQDAPDPADTPANRGFDLGGEDGAFKIWSTFKLYEDQDLQHDQDVQELIQRLQEAAQHDTDGVASFLKSRPDLAQMLGAALKNPTADTGWGNAASKGVGSIRGGGVLA